MNGQILVLQETQAILLIFPDWVRLQMFRIFLKKIQIIFILGYSPYLSSRTSKIKPSEELKLTLKFQTISSDLPAKLHLELCDEEGNVVFKKRQNIYYVKLQEKLCTLDSDHDYILKVTSIQDDVKTDEEVLIQNKQACDGKVQGK